MKTQCTYVFAEYANAHRVAIRIEDAKERELTIEDLEQMKSKDADKDGKRKIVPKEEVKEHLGRSPDYDDSLMDVLRTPASILRRPPTADHGPRETLLSWLGV